MSSWPAYDHTIQAMVGMAWSGREDDVPSQGRGFSIDCFSGYVAFSNILGALLRRERTGEGQFLDVAMLDASLVLLAVGAVRQMITGDTAAALQPIVHDRPTVGPYRTRDGWLWLSVNFQNQYAALCRVLDAPDLLNDEKFKDTSARTANSAALREALARRLETESAIELEPRLMAAGCPASVVRTSHQATEMPHLRDRGVLQETHVPGRDEPVTLINGGVVANVDGPSLTRPIPALGADTNDVLAELGYSAAEIAHLHEAGAV